MVNHVHAFLLILIIGKEIFPSAVVVIAATILVLVVEHAGCHGGCLAASSRTVERLSIRTGVGVSLNIVDVMLDLGHFRMRDVSSGTVFN